MRTPSSFPTPCAKGSFFFVDTNSKNKSERVPYEGRAIIRVGLTCEKKTKAHFVPLRGGGEGTEHPFARDDDARTHTRTSRLYHRRNVLYDIISTLNFRGAGVRVSGWGLDYGVVVV